MAKYLIVLFVATFAVPPTRKLPFPNWKAPTPSVPKISVSNDPTTDVYEVLLSLSPAPFTTETLTQDDRKSGGDFTDPSEGYREKTDVDYVRVNKRKRKRRYSTDPDAETFFTKYTLPPITLQPQTKSTVPAPPTTASRQDFSTTPASHALLTPVEAVQITAAALMILGT